MSFLKIIFSLKKFMPKNWYTKYTQDDYAKGLNFSTVSDLWHLFLTQSQLIVGSKKSKLAHWSMGAF